ncbi:flagellar motor switch protein FliM [Geobacter sp. DSM 9736]|uniref:flagellar motor switch protein FliM n=1 Tax=Geobacter sp. DSM 9736 TaxID=1277350 RepID=UPI000B50806B|nr:flagellar motor switch protein FliM [Geobacter sp. DSM 9736]SNB47051.1 flagellar motor switch protein FliM [Geobacter sp. DSM 9736]
MENILSKEEIEALLSAVFEGKIDPEKELAREGGGVSNYNLFSTDPNKGFVPNLDIIYDGFIRYNRGNMSARLRKLVEYRKVGAKVLKFEDFLQTLPSPVCMAIYKIDPLKGASLIAMDSTLVFTIVDSILGGTGKPNIPQNNRLFTSIELRLMEKIVRDMLTDMEKAWAPLHATRMNLLKMEVNPRMVSIVPSEYQVITMSLEIQVEATTGTMVFAVPYMTIDPIRDKLKSGSHFDLLAVDPQWSYRLSAELTEAPLDVSVEMGRAKITMAELLHLAPGDTILLEDRPNQNELTVKVAGVDKFSGIAGVRNGNKAARISGVLNRGGVQ